MVKLHLTGGDGFGWALDEHLETYREALPADVTLTSIQECEVIHSVWPRGILHLGSDALKGKRVISDFDNPLSLWATVPEFRSLWDVVGLWVCHTTEALDQAKAAGLSCVHVPYCLRTDVFHPLAPAVDRAQLRRKWGIPEDVYLIGNFQRDTEGVDLSKPKLQKGPDVFAEIVREVQAHGHPIHVLLAGPRRHWLRSRLKEYGVPCTYIGQVVEGDDLKLNLRNRGELNELYHTLDLCLLTSRWEGAMYATLEGAGTRCKMLSTKVGLTGDILHPDCLYSDIVEAVDKIVLDMKSNSLGQHVDAHFNTVMSGYTPENINSHVKKLFENIPSIPVFKGLPERSKHLISKSSGNSFFSRVKRLANRVNVLKKRKNGLTVSIFRDFVKPPYGGANQFMLALRNSLEERGVNVLNNEVGEYVDAYLFDSAWFKKSLLDKLARIKNPKVIHRLDGIIHLYRGSDRSIDDEIHTINANFATTTVVQSMFSLNQVIGYGYTPVCPIVIKNAADPKIFHARGRADFSRDRKVRLVTTCWSDNPRKGGAVYKWLDDHLDHDKYEYLYIGRSSESFARISQTKAVPSDALADKMRQQDIFITASQNESCSNALVEALSCGLPTIYLNSGCQPELVGMGGLGFDAPEEISGLLDKMVDHYESFQACVRAPEMGKVVDAYLACLEG